MDEQWRFDKRIVFLLFFTVLLSLAACQPTVDLTLPTLVPAVGVAVVASPTPIATPSPTNIPATFTPNPAGTVDNSAWVGRPLSTPLNPSITPTIPTSTPRPTSIPPVIRTRLPTLTPIAPLPTAVDSSAPPPHHPPPYTGFTRSKLSIHIIRNNDPNIIDFVRQAHPRVLKSVDDLGFMTEVKEISPHTVTVGRVDDISIQNYLGTPQEAAQEYVNKHLHTYHLNPGVDYWEGWNEPDPGLEWMSWYAQFEQERVKLMAQAGLRSAIGGFPPGVPEVEEFALFLPAIETTLQYGGILTLHEGDIEKGDMRYLYGSALPGFPFYEDRGALSFRYRWFYRELLEPAGLVIPLVISELEFSGWDMMGEQYLLYDQLAWYDSESQKDDYVIGFTVFTAGAIGYWDQFDLNGLLPEMAAYVNNQN